MLSTVSFSLYLPALNYEYRVRLRPHEKPIHPSGVQDWYLFEAPDAPFSLIPHVELIATFIDWRQTNTINKDSKVRRVMFNQSN
jgi:hypothetical protein